MSKWWPLKVVSFVQLASLSVAAQSSSDLERKYGRPDNHLVRRTAYDIRPGVIMTASFASGGQVCEAVIEPKRVTESGIDLERRIPAALAREIVDEIAPAGQRGRQLGGITMGNYTSTDWANYEKVSIYTVLVGVGGPETDLKVDEVRIKWKGRQCQ